MQSMLGISEQKHINIEIIKHSSVFKNCNLRWYYNTAYLEKGAIKVAIYRIYPQNILASILKPHLKHYITFYKRETYFCNKILSCICLDKVHQRTKCVSHLCICITKQNCHTVEYTYVEYTWRNSRWLYIYIYITHPYFRFVV